MKPVPKPQKPSPRDPLRHVQPCDMEEALKLSRTMHHSDLAAHFGWVGDAVSICAALRDLDAMEMTR